MSTKKVIELENKNHDPNKVKSPSIRLRNINQKLGKIQKMKEELNRSKNILIKNLLENTNNEKPVPKTKRTNDFTLKNTTPKAKMSSNTLWHGDIEAQRIDRIAKFVKPVGKFSNNDLSKVSKYF